MISTWLSRASMTFLLVGGLVLLFAADELLPRLISGFPAGGAWLGQFLAAAWMALGMLNWFNQQTLLGGIYGRPVAMTNAIFYFIAAISLVKVAARDELPPAGWAVAVPMTVFAIAYVWLLFRGPLERDIWSQRGSGD